MAEAESTGAVQVHVKAPFTLTAQDGQRHTFAPGQQELPAWVADHWWAKHFIGDVAPAPTPGAPDASVEALVRARQQAEEQVMRLTGELERAQERGAALEADHARLVAAVRAPYAAAVAGGFSGEPEEWLASLPQGEAASAPEAPPADEPEDAAPEGVVAEDDDGVDRLEITHHGRKWAVEDGSERLGTYDTRAAAEQARRDIRASRAMQAPGA